MRRVMSLTERIEALNQTTVVVLTVMVVVAIGLMDHVTGWDVRVYPFYFVPIAMASWRFTRRGTWAAGLGCTAVWFASNVAARWGGQDVLVQTWNTLAHLSAFIALGLLVAQQRNMMDRERAHARTDGLTGLPNARGFRDLATQQLALAHRNGLAITVAYVDLDGFKAVNDRHGHAAGDQALVLMAETSRGCLRAVDILARLGGDEFAVVLHNASDDHVVAVLERMRSAVAQAMTQRGWQVTVSVGAVTHKVPPAQLDALLQPADQLMYEVKAAGKNAWRHLVLENPVPPPANATR